MKGIEITLINFILHYVAEGRNSVIKKEQASVNLSFQRFLTKISFVLDKMPKKN